MGKFDPKKNKRFLSKLTIEQRDQIMITLILLKQMIDADGVENQEEKEYLENYLINCGITSQDELYSILGSATSLTEDEYDNVVGNFNQDQKLKILHELIEVICSDNEIDENELVLLFNISRDMNVEDDIIIDMLAPKKDLINKSNEKKDEGEKKENILKKHKEKNFTDKNEFFEAVKLVDTNYLVELNKMALKISNSGNGNEETEIKIYTQIINEIPLFNNESGGVAYGSEDLIEFDLNESKININDVILEETYFNRAQAFTRIKNYEEAEKDYKKAIDVNPKRNDATFYHYLGCAKLSLKRPIDDILHCFDNSIKYNESDSAFALKLSESYYMRAGAKLINENIIDAKKDIEKAFELDPEDKAIQRLKGNIDEILKNNSINETSRINSDLKTKKTDEFCSKCGEHFNSDESFCNSCGNKRNIVKIESKEKERVQKKNKNLKLEEELKKLRSYLETITVKDKGKIYDLNYWFDNVVARVESHEIYYGNRNINNLNSLKEIAHSHYDEYHHRMIEESDENKLEFVVPRVECFLKIFKKIDEIKNENLIEEDVDLYDRYYFHSKSSLYGAVKFLKNDIEVGLDELQKIFPNYDEEILSYQRKEHSDEIISKTKNMLSPLIRTYLNKILIQNAERFINQKNSSAYSGLEEMIDISLPIDTEIMIDENKATKEIENLSIEEKEYLNRVIKGTFVYSKLNHWDLFISNTVNELSKLGVSIDKEFELEDQKNPKFEDEWEEVGNKEEGLYALIKRNQKGIVVHKKFYVDGKLERFDLSKQKAELDDAVKHLNSLLYYSFGSLSKEDIGLKEKSEKHVRLVTEMKFWQIYNSYDNEDNLPHSILNDYSYFLYDLNQYEAGIHLASLAFKIEGESRYADTVGEGYFKQEYFDMAFSFFSKSIEIDKKNDCHREEHIINYIKAALKTENLKSAQNGIDLLKENFTENKDIKNFEKELNSLISNSEEFKCPECGHIPKISQKFCTKCGTKFKQEDLQEDNYYENITTYLKAKNETLFLFVKKHIEIAKKGETYPEEVLIRSITKFINKLKKDKELFEDIFDKRGIKKTVLDKNYNNMMFLTLYPQFFINDDIETLAKVLNETESDKFDGYSDIEQYYSYYVYIRDFMFNESKKYME